MQTNGDKAPGLAAYEHAGHRDWHRVTVTEAAAILGVTESAVRKRVQRGSIPHEKEESGRLYVYLDPHESRPMSGKVRDGHASRSRPARPGQSHDDYARSLEARVGFLEEQVRRQTEVIADLVRRVPELEAPPGARETHEPQAEGSDPHPATEGAEEGAQRRSWLYRFFFGS